MVFITEISSELPGHSIPFATFPALKASQPALSLWHLSPVVTLLHESSTKDPLELVIIKEASWITSILV